MKILVRRTGALGDVVLATPVVRRLKRENPDADVAVVTAYAGVFANNPHLDANVSPEAYVSADRTVDLDLAYERRPTMHVVEAYMEEAFGDRGEPADRRQELFFDRRPVFAPNTRRRYVAVHAAKAGWRSRTLPDATWLAVCEDLKRAGFWPILVGTERDALPDARCTSFHSHDLMAQATLIASCACFVGPDSALLHVAGATDVPIVGVFTCADPKFRLPWRDGCVGLTPQLPCVGCLHRREPPVTTDACLNDERPFACVDAGFTVSAGEIVGAVDHLVGK